MYEVNLDVYQGPFHLLLALITERRVDVCDVPIAQLTNEYLAHIDQLDRSDLDSTTEFLVVAATLLALKARALLPVAPEQLDEDDELERDLLISRLLEVQTFQAAGAHLAELLTNGDRRFASHPASDDDAVRQLPALVDVAASDLGRALVELASELSRGIDTSRVLVDQVSTEEASRELVGALQQGPTSFRDIADGRNVSWKVALFLAMLEMAMRGELSLGEGMTVGEIRLALVA